MFKKLWNWITGPSEVQIRVIEVPKKEEVVWVTNPPAREEAKVNRLKAIEKYINMYERAYNESIKVAIKNGETSTTDNPYGYSIEAYLAARRFRARGFKVKIKTPIQGIGQKRTKIIIISWK